MAEYDLRGLLGGAALFRERPGDDASASWVARIRRGLPAGSLDAFAEQTAIGRARLLAVLGVPERTAARRKGKHLRPDESDRLYRLAHLTALAAETLGSLDKASAWLQRDNRALGGVCPLDLTDTDAGARAVEAVLGRIAHGIVG